MQNEQELNELFPSPTQYREELLELFQGDTSAQALREILSDYHSNDIASIFPLLTAEQRSSVYNALDSSALSDIFSYLKDADLYTAELEVSQLADIIDEMDADDAVDLLEQLEQEQRDEMLDLLDEEVKEDVSLISSFDDTLIGSRMSTNYIVVKKHFSVKDAMRALVEQAAENDNVQTLFVTDGEEQFYGAIDLRDLIVVREGQPLEDIITTKYPFFFADTPVEDCLEELRTYSENAIPILDRAHRLIGVITATDVLETVQEEFSEDYAMLAGLTEGEDLKESLLRSIKKRLPWLLLLLGLGLVVSAVIQRFQEHLPTSLVVLYTFQSLILGMSGNAGTQSLAVTIRVLSGKKLSAKETLLFVLKELRVGLCNGIIVGALSFAFIGLVLQLLPPESLAAVAISGFGISACIGISLAAAMAAASLGGTCIPILFKKLGIDPAVASGPLITTLNDLIAVCTYYGLSILLFSALL